MKKLCNWILTFTILFPSLSFAGFLIEPYLGYGISGDGSLKLSGNGTDHDLNYHNFTFGGKLGAQGMGIMGGFDYGASSYKLKSVTSSNNYEDSVEQDQIGVFFGYNFPVLVRLYASYYFAATLDGVDPPSASHQIDNRDEFTGDGYALGIGFTGIPLFSLNLEFRKFNYDTWKVSGVEQSYIDFSLSEIMLSVSMPINL